MSTAPSASKSSLHQVNAVSTISAWSSCGHRRVPRSTIALVLTERSGGGSSVADLVDVIRSRTRDSDLLIRLDSIIAQAIGEDWRSLQQVRFDLQSAIESLRFFDAKAIPSVHVPLPPEVTDVHFRVDLTHHDPPSARAAIQECRLFRAARPSTL